MRFIHVESKDNTDVLIVTDKIQYIIQMDDGHCMIGLDDGHCIRTGATFGDLKRALKG